MNIELRKVKSTTDYDAAEWEYNGARFSLAFPYELYALYTDKIVL